MGIDTKTATAAMALLIGAGAYPFAAAAQTETEGQDVEVEVIEGDAEQATEETAEGLEQAGEETGEAIGQAAEETGQALDQAAEETGQAVEQTAEETGEAVEVDTSSADDLDDRQKQELEAAAAEGKPVPRPEMIIGVQKEGDWLSSELIGSEIRNQNDEDIGDISAILFTDQGPKGVIVDVGGFLGLGEKEVAIRWEELAMTEQGVTIDTPADALENAPEFLTLEEQRQEAELQAQQQAAEAQQQAAQQPETLEPAPETTEQMATEQPAEGEVETIE